MRRRGAARAREAGTPASERGERRGLGFLLAEMPLTDALLLPAVLLAFLLSVAGCGGGGDGGGSGEGEEAHEEGEAEVVHVEPEHVEEWGLVIGPPGTTDLATELTLPGVLGLDENRTARVASLIPGQIAGVHVDLGDRVGPGDRLVTLNAPEFARAQTEYLQAFTQAELSRSDFERARTLRGERALEEREFLRRAALYEEHLADLRAAEGVLQALGVDPAGRAALSASVEASVGGDQDGSVSPLLPIRTPVGGAVIQRDAVLGDPVEPGRVLFTVSDLSLLWARLDAYENQLQHLGRSAEVVIRSALFPDREFPGRITFVADQVDPELRTVRVRAEVPNPDGTLKPNMYVQGFLRIRDPERTRLVVPQDAVQLHEGHSVVFVEVPAEEGEEHRVFEAREVTAGEVLTEGQVILAGLDGSEQVVTRGAFLLKAELTKGAGGHAHVH